MTTLRTISALTAAALLAACAQPPSAIAPVSMGNAFAALSCNEAATMLNTELQTLAALEARQSNAAVTDAMTVFLVLVPVSSLTGQNVAGDLATSKGKVEALRARLTGC